MSTLFRKSKPQKSTCLDYLCLVKTQNWLDWNHAVAWLWYGSVVEHHSGSESDQSLIDVTRWTGDIRDFIIDWTLPNIEPTFLHSHSDCILIGGTSLDVSPACRYHSPPKLLLNVPGQVAAFWEIH